MNCHSFFHSSIHIIIHSCLLEVLLHWKDSTRDLENWSIAEECRELLSIHSSRSDDDFDISSLLGDFLKDAEEDISVETSFMGLVHNDRTVHLQLIVVETLTE